MSLKVLSIPLVPEETARVVRAIFPCGNILMQLRDTLGTIYTDETFVDLFPTHGQPAETPWRLALITVLQFMKHPRKWLFEGMEAQHDSKRLSARRSNFANSQ